MAIESKKSMNDGAAVSFSIKSPSGVTSNQSVSLSSHWSYSQNKRMAEMFHVGGGCVYNSYPEHNNGFGSYVFTPQEDFIGEVHLWGAGGGAYHNSGGRYAGGGGFTQATIRFKANTPYTIVVGQAGNHNNSRTHGGGGHGWHNSGGAGGGLSGIFMGVEYNSTAVWTTSPPLSQSAALAIAGGGGGGGHHNQGSHYGNGGGGGGWNGKRGHAGSGGTQTSGGSAGYSASAGAALSGGNSSTQETWVGGGGGGWYGGGGGGHGATNHYNGGSGGSGHIAYTSAIASQPNNDKAVYILNGFTDKAPGHMEYSSGHPAAYNHPLCATEGRWAGQGGHGENNSGFGCTWGPRHGKVVITLLPTIVGEIMEKLPTHTAAHDNTGWTQSF